MKGQMRQADRAGASHALILDADGSIQLRDMRSGEQREVEAGRVVEELSGV
jgi:histidyl-tRNA synthetase